jgi:NAD-dependent SIR2 family protein deacetylase
MNSLINSNLLNEVTKLIRRADALLICAGAGMGVDSGLPDFRGNHGFWKAYPVLEQEGLSFIDLANPQGFENNPNTTK